MGPPLYMQSIIDWNVVMWHMTVNLWLGFACHIYVMKIHYIYQRKHI